MRIRESSGKLINMLGKDQYFKTVRRPYPPLFSSIILEGYSNPKYYKGFLPRNYALRDLILTNGEWYYPKRDFQLAQNLAFKWWYNPKRLLQIQKLFNKREGNLINSTTNDFKDFCSAYEAYMPALLLIFAVEASV